MAIIFLTGGLGGQMLQYAFYRYLIRKLGKNVYLDASSKTLNDHTGFELLRLFPNIRIENKINDPYLIKRIKHILFSTFYKYNFWFIAKDKNMDVRERIFHEIIYLGYWFQCGYINDMREQMLTDFEFIPFDEQQNIELAEQIRASNSVGVHIRRGDFYKTAATRALLGGICTIDYYKAAIKRIKETCEAPVFFVFSNEMDWVKENLQFDTDVFFIDWNTGQNSFRDMQLMSICKHNIIANSSFSWWGAFLNKNQDKIVIAPSKWINGADIFNSWIISDSWIKL
jgi:hypothetical protein